MRPVSDIHAQQNRISDSEFELVEGHHTPPGKMYTPIGTDESHVKLEPTHPQRSKWRKAAVHLWLWEWLAWLIALLAIAAIVGVLIAFDNKSIPDWPYGITLGALVSVLATIATVGLAEPLAAGLGQAKWLWYTKERGLADFELVDSASRGPIGSVLLVLKGRGGFFAITGGLLLVASQAVGPFAQQVVQYDTKTRTASTGSVPIATLYDTYGTDGGDVSLSMKAAIQRGMMDASANTSTFFVNPQCPTGNCTWPTDKPYYTSLSVCGRCADVSSQLTVNEKDGFANISLPNNVTLEYTPNLTKQGLIAMTVNTTSNALSLLIDSLEYSEWDWPLIDVFTIVPQYGDKNNDAKLMGPFASECILQFCVQNFSASSVNGRFVEEPRDSPTYLNGTYTFNVEDAGTNYTLEYETFKALQQYFETSFNKVTEQSNGLSASTQWDDDTSQSLFYYVNSSADHLPTQMFEDIAASMSLNVRTASNLSQAGFANWQISVVSVQWPWMILPVSILALVGLFLVGTVTATRRAGLEPWKTSSLAVFMHGIAEDESRRLIEGAEGLDEMNVLANRLRMRSTQGSVMVDEVRGQSGTRLHTSMLVQLWHDKAS